VELLFANLAISARTICILALFPTKGLLSALFNWDTSDFGLLSDLQLHRLSFSAGMTMI